MDGFRGEALNRGNAKNDENQHDHDLRPEKGQFRLPRGQMLTLPVPGIADWDSICLLCRFPEKVTLPVPATALGHALLCAIDRDASLSR